MLLSVLAQPNACLDLPPSSVFAKRYRVSRRLGAGGFGSVYESTHLVTGRRCALKVLLPHLAQDADFRTGFLRESRVTAQLESEHIVDVLDAGIDDDTDIPFMVMELLNGEDLSRRLRRKGKFSPAETIVYLGQVALALEQAHKYAIIHRDLKPGNLFLTRRLDGGPLVKILDFGIAKVLAEQSTRSVTTSAGTPLYMAPEQFRREAVSAQVDVYAMGMLAFIFLVGKHYFRLEREQCENAYALALTLVEGPAESATARAARYGAQLPPAFNHWFARASHADPRQRHGSAREAVIDLCACFGIPVPEELRERPSKERVGALSVYVESAIPPEFRAAPSAPAPNSVPRGPQAPGAFQGKATTSIGPSSGARRGAKATLESPVHPPRSATGTSASHAPSNAIPFSTITATTRELAQPPPVLAQTVVDSHGTVPPSSAAPTQPMRISEASAPRISLPEPTGHPVSMPTAAPASSPMAKRGSTGLVAVLALGAGVAVLSVVASVVALRMPHLQRPPALAHMSLPNPPLTRTPAAASAAPTTSTSPGLDSPLTKSSERSSGTTARPASRTPAAPASSAVPTAPAPDDVPVSPTPKPASPPTKAGETPDTLYSRE